MGNVARDTVYRAEISASETVNQRAVNENGKCWNRLPLGPSGDQRPCMYISTCVYSVDQGSSARRNDHVTADYFTGQSSKDR